MPYAPARRLVSRWRWYLILLVVVSPLLALVVGVTGRSVSRVADGQLVLERVELRAATAGYVSQVNVAPQGRVSAGAVVVRLNDPGIASAEARLRAALDAPGKAPATAGSLALVERELSFQKRRMQAIDELFRAGAATAAEVGEATAALQRAEQATVERRSAAALQALATTSSAREQRDVVAQLAALQRQRERLTARSPGPGSVLEVYVAPGEYVAAGSRLVAIGNTQLPTVEAYVEPRMMGTVAPGSAATVRFPDGTRVDASVQALPATMAARPAAALDRRNATSIAVQLVVADAAGLPRAVRVDGLPVRVRFQYSWERTPAGRIVGRALAWLSGYG